MAIEKTLLSERSDNNISLKSHPNPLNSCQTLYKVWSPDSSYIIYLYFL